MTQGAASSDVLSNRQPRERSYRARGSVSGREADKRRAEALKRGWSGSVLRGLEFAKVPTAVNVEDGSGRKGEVAAGNRADGFGYFFGLAPSINRGHAGR